MATTNTTDHHTVGVRLQRKLYELLSSDAKMQHRTASNMISFIVASYYESKAPKKQLNGHAHTNGKGASPA